MDKSTAVFYRPSIVNPASRVDQRTITSNRGIVTGTVGDGGELWHLPKDGTPILRVIVVVLERVFDLAGNFTKCQSDLSIVFSGRIAADANKKIRNGQILQVEGLWEQRVTLNRETGDHGTTRELRASRFQVLHIGANR